MLKNRISEKEVLCVCPLVCTSIVIYSLPIYLKLHIKSRSNSHLHNLRHTCQTSKFKVPSGASGRHAPITDSSPCAVKLNNKLKEITKLIKFMIHAE